MAAYNVLTVPEEGKSSKGKQPGVKPVICLMLLITDNGFRYFVAKMFDENLDILGGKTIKESIGAREGDRSDEYS